MKDLLDNSMVMALAVVLVIAIIVAGGYGISKVFNPKYQELRHETFIEGTQYQQGKIQYLSTLMHQYQATESDNIRAALRTKILTEASMVDNTILPVDLREFIQSL